MDDLWITMAFVWLVAEAIGYFRNIDFPQRMKTAAIWAVAINSLAMVGKPVHDPGFMYFVTSILFNAAVAIPIYYYRLAIFKYIKNRYVAANANNANQEADTENVFIFQLNNGVTQLIAAIAGFFTGLLINGIIIAAIAISKNY